MDQHNLIKGIKGYSDSIWIDIRPSVAAVQLISKIFELDEMFEEFDNFIGEGLKYETISSNFQLSTHCLDTSEYIAYIIFDKERIHVILRKTRKYEKYRDLILETLKVAEKHRETS